jgi:hypothetical protein
MPNHRSTFPSRPRTAGAVAERQVSCSRPTSNDHPSASPPVRRTALGAHEGRGVQRQLGREGLPGREPSRRHRREPALLLRQVPHARRLGGEDRVDRLQVNAYGTSRS